MRVLGVDLGPGREQKLGELDVPALCSKVKRRPTVVVSSTGIGALGE